MIYSFSNYMVLYGRESSLASLGYKAIYINCKMQIFPWWLVSLGKSSPFSCDPAMEENTALILIHYKLISHSTYCVVCRNICDQGFDVNYVNSTVRETRSNVIFWKQNRIEPVFSQISSISHWPRIILIVIVRTTKKTFA